MNSVPLLLESIRCVDGEPELLDLHQKRINRSLAEYGITPSWQLVDYLSEHPCPAKLHGVVKCRLLYSEEPLEVGYATYTQRIIHSLRCVQTDSVDYHIKWADRSALQSLVAQRGAADEILIVSSDGLLTDSSYTNVALRQSGQWYTPRVPLLEGVQRAQLVAEGVLTLRDIAVTELRAYDRIALFNAMMPWSERIELTISACDGLMME